MKVVIRALGIMMLTLAASRCGTAEEPKIRRFDVVPVDDKAILIDTATGNTWLLEKSPTADNKSGHVWQRIPSPPDMAAPPVIPRPGAPAQYLVPFSGSAGLSIKSESLNPQQANAGFRKDDGEVVWSNIPMVPYTITRLAVMAKARPNGEKATISWEVIGPDRKPITASAEVLIKPKPVPKSQTATWGESDDTNEKSDVEDGSEL